MDRLAAIDTLAEQAENLLSRTRAIIVDWHCQAPKKEDGQQALRFLHTVKGGCGFLGLQEPTRLAHACESLISDLMQGLVRPTPAISRALDSALADIAQQVDDPWSDHHDRTSGHLAALLPYLPLDQAEHDEQPPLPLRPTPVQARRALAEQQGLIRITVGSRTDLDRLGLGPLDLSDLLGSVGNPLAVGIDIDAAGDLSHCLEVDLHYQILLATAAGIDELALLTDLPVACFQVLDAEDLLPAASDCAGLCRSTAALAERLAADLGKAVRVTWSSPDSVALGPGLAAVVQTVLTHGLRNALDHGIETAAERRAAGKTAWGSFAIDCELLEDPRRLQLRLSDDGRGFDTAALRVKAEAAGHRPPADAHLWDLARLPGISTAERVTEYSGRGIGLDALAATVAEHDGKIALTSEAGAGSQLTVELPLAD